jgi:hypothetical protein
MAMVYQISDGMRKAKEALLEGKEGEVLGGVNPLGALRSP